MKKLTSFVLTMLMLATYVFLGSVEPVSAQTCPNTPTSGNSVTTTFDIPESTTYTIWTRILAPDASNNSIYIQVDGGCAINVGDSATTANQFTWVNHQDGNTANIIQLQLSAGTHTLKLIEREGGVGIDRLIISTNTACMPTGIGDNCQVPTSTPIVFSTPTASPAATNTPAAPTNTPVPTSTPLPTLTPTQVPAADAIRPVVSITAPANNSIVTRGRAFTITANATDNVAIRQVQFSVSGKGGNASCTDTTFPYSCNWSVPSKPSTQYTINAVATDTSGNTATATIGVTSSK